MQVVNQRPCIQTHPQQRAEFLSATCYCTNPPGRTTFHAAACLTHAASPLTGECEVLAVEEAAKVLEAKRQLLLHQLVCRKDKWPPAA